MVFEDLLQALQRMQRVVTAGSGSHSGEAFAPRQESIVIAVLGSRARVGCTSIAVNLGATLAQDAALGVALVDLDLALGNADVALDLMADYTLADVAQNVDRMDMQFLKRALAKHSSGLSFLPPPMRMEDATLIHEDQMQRSHWTAAHGLHPSDPRPVEEFHPH